MPRLGARARPLSEVRAQRRRRRAGGRWRRPSPPRRGGRTDARRRRRRRARASRPRGGHHHRPRRRHRLDDGQAEGLVPQRGHDHHVGGGVEALDVVAQPEEAHVIGRGRASPPARGTQPARGPRRRPPASASRPTRARARDEHVERPSPAQPRDAGDDLAIRGARAKLGAQRRPSAAAKRESSMAVVDHRQPDRRRRTRRRGTLSATKRLTAMRRSQSPLRRGRTRPLEAAHHQRGRGARARRMAGMHRLAERDVIVQDERCAQPPRARSPPAASTRARSGSAPSAGGAPPYHHHARTPPRRPGRPAELEQAGVATPRAASSAESHGRQRAPKHEGRAHARLAEPRAERDQLRLERPALVRRGIEHQPDRRGPDFPAEGERASPPLSAVSIEPSRGGRS